MLSIDDLFERAAVQRIGAVPWGTDVPLSNSGVYVVASTPQGDLRRGLIDCPLDSAAVATLLEARPEATVDGEAADADLLSKRLAEMWVPGHPIIYIGLAGTSVQKRVRQFYSTVIGARAPHAGGWPVKMLKTRELWVHYGACSDYDFAEQAMVQEFMGSVPDQVRRSLVDPNLPLPFANLTVPRGARKRHGIAGVKEARKARSFFLSAHEQPLPSATAVSPVALLSTSLPEGAVRPTQNVTAGDVARGALRVPRASKDIFPSEIAKIRVSFGSETYDATWNPRTSGDRERSGTISLSRGRLEGLIASGRPRQILTVIDGYRIE